MRFTSVCVFVSAAEGWFLGTAGVSLRFQRREKTVKGNVEKKKQTNRRPLKQAIKMKSTLA